MFHVYNIYIIYNFLFFIFKKNQTIKSYPSSQIIIKQLVLCIPSTRKKKKKGNVKATLRWMLPDAVRLMTKNDLSKTEQVPDPETQRGHGMLSSGPLAEKAQEPAGQSLSTAA